MSQKETFLRKRKTKSGTYRFQKNFTVSIKDKMFKLNLLRRYGPGEVGDDSTEKAVV